MTQRKHTTPTEPPFAEIVSITEERVTILCPLCYQQHTHAGYAIGRTERRVAACDLWAPVSQTTKATGYRYKVTASHV